MYVVMNYSGKVIGLVEDGYMMDHLKQFISVISGEHEVRGTQGDNGEWIFTAGTIVSGAPIHTFRVKRLPVWQAAD